MSVEAKGGKASITNWRVLRRFRNAMTSELEVRPETGRTHQIRVHLSSAGLPLVGDTVYGRSRGNDARLGRPALHAAHLGFDHPVTGRRLSFETPLPESSVFYLLRWHPELNGTRLADHVAAEASGAPRSARDGLTDARVAEIHGAAIPRTSAAAVVVALLALLFGLHEDIQDTIIEEVFTFLPLASGFVAERTPGLESAGEDVGAAFGMVVVGALVAASSY